MHKEYFLIKELKTFDEAIAICENRYQRLVQIKSREENEFIFRTIIRPGSHNIWLGATNLIGSVTFRWLDGSELNYFGLENIFLVSDVNKRNGLMMHAGNAGKWFGFSVSSAYNVLCENELLETATTPPLSDQSTQCNMLIQSFDVLEQRYYNLSQDVIELQKVNSNKFSKHSVISKLQEQTNDLATELEFQKQHSNQ